MYVGFWYKPLNATLINPKNVNLFLKNTVRMRQQSLLILDGQQSLVLAPAKTRQSQFY
jgi:hypothetical protein